MSNQQARTPVLPQEQPLISFVIPVWNVSGQMIRQCLDSILQVQLSATEREIIIVDDGNEDSLAAQKPTVGSKSQPVYNSQTSKGPANPSECPCLKPSKDNHNTIKKYSFPESADPTPDEKASKQTAELSPIPLSISDSTHHYYSLSKTLLHYQNAVVCVTQPHSGQSAARNTGIAKAHGRFIQFVDADDWLDPSAYNHIVDLARHDKGDMILFRFRESHEAAPKDKPCPYCKHSRHDNADRQNTYHRTAVHPFSKTAAPSYHDADSVSGPEWLCHHNMRASVCSYLFRRELLGELRFNPSLIREDEEFTPLLLLNAQRLIETTATAYIYRQHEGSVMHQRSERKREKALRDIEYIIHHLNSLKASEHDKRREALHRRVCQLSMDHLYNTIRYTHSRQQLRNTIDFLRDEGLFPLPHHPFTYKYWLFSYITASAAGRATLLHIL